MEGGVCGKGNVMSCGHLYLPPSLSTLGYSPIRFRGNTQVSLNLGYTFFYHLEQGRNQNNVPGGNDAGPGAGTGVGPIDGEGLPPGKRRNERESGKKRRDISVADSPVQEVEVRFRMVILRSTALLFSQTSSSVHLIAVCILTPNDNYLTKYYPISNNIS